MRYLFRFVVRDSGSNDNSVLVVSIAWAQATFRPTASTVDQARRRERGRVCRAEALESTRRRSSLKGLRMALGERRFPVQEKYNLASQLRRAVTLVPLNIAEAAAQRAISSLAASLAMPTVH